MRDLTENWSLLAGFRYLELDDNMQVQLVNPGIPFDYRTGTRNRLYGAQLGSKLNLWNNDGIFSLQAVGKAGVFENMAAQGSSISTGLLT